MYHVFVHCILIKKKPGINEARRVIKVDGFHLLNTTAANPTADENPAADANVDDSDGDTETDDGIDDSTPLEQIEMNQVPIKCTEPHNHLDISDRIWFWDMEAGQCAPRTRELSTKQTVMTEDGPIKVGKSMTSTEHVVYNVGYCKITDLYEMERADKTKRCKACSAKNNAPKMKFVQNHNNRTRMEPRVQCKFGENALPEFVDFLQKLANEARAKHEVKLNDKMKGAGDKRRKESITKKLGKRLGHHLDSFLVNIKEKGNDARRAKYLDMASQVCTKEEDIDFIVRKMVEADKYLSDEWFKSEYERERLQSIRHHKITFVAYNSARYDHFLLLKNHTASMGLDAVLTSHGFLTLTLFKYLNFTDFFRHTMCSLDKLCKSFKLPEIYSKGSFPHEFMRVDDNGKLPLDYVGPPPEAKYWPGGKMEDGLPAEWNLKEYSIKYQKLDVIAMGICYME
eukprot:Lithocolla_globosa_v1_NODE_3931_length_1548_cov_75.653717.p1 type:complete len:455 gc:universal NODE_3931_length_1548_cov_75.653717:1530-166(-)